mgnify:CR=1 FL=1
MFLPERLCKADHIFLLDFSGWMGETLCDCPAIGQDNQAFTVVIQAAGIVDAASVAKMRWESLKNGGSSFRVIAGTKASHRFIEQNGYLVILPF